MSSLPDGACSENAAPRAFRFLGPYRRASKGFEGFKQGSQSVTGCNSLCLLLSRRSFRTMGTNCPPKKNIAWLQAADFRVVNQRGTSEMFQATEGAAVPGFLRLKVPSSNSSQPRIVPDAMACSPELWAKGWTTSSDIVA